MQRKTLFLVAAIAESVRFLVLAVLADALGGLRDGMGLPSFFRYAAGGQLFFVIGFFFLWFDQPRHDAYRSLLFVGKIVSLATFIPLAIAMTGVLRAGRPVDGSSLIFTLAIFGVDTFGFCLLLVSKPFGGSVGRSPSVPAPIGQSPDEIERVESL